MDWKGHSGTEKSEAYSVMGALIDSAGDAIVIEDLSGAISHWNKAAEKLFRVPTGEALGRAFHVVAPAATRDAEARMRGRVRQGEVARDVETVRLRGDGSKVEVSATLSPIMSAAGRVIGVSHVLRDITARKAQERGQSRRADMLNTFLESAQIGLHRVNAEGIILWANEAELRMLGYRADEYIGHHVGEFHTDQAVLNEIIAALLAGKKLYEYEARLRCKDGSIKHVLIDSSVFWEDGHFAHAQCFTRDVSRRKQAEQELRLAKTLAQQTVERITDGFLAVDPSWRITFINDYAAEVFGRVQSAHELLGKQLWESFPGAAGTMAEAEYRRAMAEQAPTKFENYNAPLRRWFEVSVYPSPDGLSIYFKEITARKELERSLRESEERFRTLADNIAQFAWMADGKGSIFWYNQRWFDYTGTTLEEMQGWGWQKVHHPDHVGRVVEKIRHAFDTGTYWEDTFPLRGKDGSYRWFLSRALPIRNERGEVVRWFGTNTDITRQREAEATIAAARDRAEESERLFRAFVTASSDVVYRMNADWTEMHRLEGKDFISDSPDPSRSWLKTYIHPDDQPRVLAAIADAIRGKKTFQLEHRVIRVDGTLGWTFSRAIPLLNSRGEISEWIGAAHDITERKEAEEALRQLTEKSEHERRLYDTLLASTPDQVCVFGLDRRFVYVNQAMLETLGRAREQVMGKSCSEAGFAPAEAANHDREIAQVISSKHLIRSEVAYSGPNGRRIYDYVFVPVLDTAGEVEAVGGSMRDVTDRKKIAENLERMVAERTAKLSETIGELEAFSYSIAHDMRAPLRSLAGYSEMLLNEHAKEVTPEAREFLERIATSAKRMDRLIIDVLNYSRVVRTELTLERVELDPLVHDIIKTYPMFARDKADIEVAEPLPAALGNEAMLTQVFSNLLGNAVKFVAPDTKPCVKVWAEFHGPRVKVSVQDNGIGVAPDQHQKIFEVFQQADTRFGGTGIGLAIVKKAVERMGGKIGLRSAPGEGSTFWIEIARAPATDFAG